ncbi:hypothetical protein [Psychroserpens algicola]|uniref:hypothetical protein n=1 Tax=Psychroserpens algicola TaxID=1719034 RepID=UPI0019534B6D|nr:hypothetical protein [Psychroserpens algicola]
MYEFNYIYGALLIDRNLDKVQEIINEMSSSDEFYYFHSSMFSKGSNNYPSFYDTSIISFSRTFKYFGYDLKEFNEFIRNIESFLDQIDFESAMIHIGGMYSDQDLFWINKKMGDKEKLGIKEIEYYETDKWFFGFGTINLSTGIINRVPNDKNEMFHIQYPNFKYPIIKK